MNRRTYLGAVGAASLAGLAGCTGLLGLDEHEANPVGVPSQVRSDTGYEQTGVDDVVIEEKVDMKLWSETISVTNYVVEHEKTVSFGPLTDQRAAVFAVLSTPQISVVGQQVNPVEDMDTAELVDMIASNYEDLGAPEHVGDKELPVLDSSVVTSTFATEATFMGNQDIEVNLHVTEAVKTEEDLVVGIGVYPRDLESRERSNVESLISAIDPSVDVGGTGDDGGDGGNTSEDSDSNSLGGVDLGL